MTLLEKGYVSLSVEKSLAVPRKARGSMMIAKKNVKFIATAHHQMQTRHEKSASCDLLLDLFALWLMQKQHHNLRPRMGLKSLWTMAKRKNQK
jgi:hypothetical protein